MPGRNYFNRFKAGCFDRKINTSYRRPSAAGGRDDKMALTKTENNLFKEYYTGTNGTRRVVCILDDYCVRYMVFVKDKLKSCREFSNDKKELCFRNAEKALNK